MDFSPKCYFLCECSSVRFGQNIQRKISSKRSILVALFHTNLLTYTESLMGPERKICIVPHAVVEGLKGQKFLNRDLTAVNIFYVPFTTTKKILKK